MLAGVTALMVLGSTGSAILITHPYVGATFAYEYSNQFGCTATSLSHKASLNLKTGSGGVAVGVLAKTPCGKPLGPIAEDSYVYLEDGIEFAVPLKVHAGSTNVTANWALGASAVTSISWKAGAKCPTHHYSYVDPSNASYDYNYTSGSCSVYASAWLLSSGYVEDLTNGSSFGINWSSLAPCYSYVGYHYCQSPNVGNYSDNYTNVYYYTYGPGSAYCSAGCVVSYNSSFGTAWTSTTGTISVSGSESFTSNGQSYQSGWVFNPAHKYILWGDLYAYIDTDVYNLPSGLAKGSVLALPISGGGWSLTSIVVS